MTKWEYCAISGIEYVVSGFRTNYPHLHQFTPSGITETQIKGQGGETNVVAATIAQMGNDGWELVGVGRERADLGDVLYFKRSKL